METSLQKPASFKIFGLMVIFLTLSFCKTASEPPGNNIIRWRNVLNQESDWYASAEAIRIADNVLVYQYKNGGWPKNIDMTEVLSEKEKEQIKKNQAGKKRGLHSTTIDNDATHTQMRYLAKVYHKTNNESFLEGFLKGVDYILESQYENGGWPQYYPIRPGYYENITFNDDAMIGVMSLLRDIVNGNPPYHIVDEKRIERSKTALEKGLDIILHTQIEVDGQLTAWCQQYDPVTLEPAGARSYEIPSICGGESVEIVRYLMSIEDPRDEIIHSVQSAVQWFKEVKFTEIRVMWIEIPKGHDVVVGLDPAGTSPIWARFYEIGTNYPIFVGRDGVVKYSLSEIERERRIGYKWLGDWAKELIAEEYDLWCEKNGI